MRFVVLGLLLVSPTTIYSLNKQFETSISLFYSASLGALRTTLKNLESAGEIRFEETIDDGRRKKIYSVTDLGRAAFFSWLASPVTETNAEVAGLSRLYFLGLLSDNTERLAVLHNILDRMQHELAKMEELAGVIDRTPVSPELVDLAHYGRMTLEWGIKSVQATCTHLNELIAQAEDN